MPRLVNRATFAALTFSSVMFCAGAARAQMVGGGIQGTVKDAQGAVLPGATVVVRNVGDRRAPTSRRRDQAGHFQVPALPPGEYEVHVSLTGFRPVVHRGIRLTVGQVAVDRHRRSSSGRSPKRSRCAPMRSRST